MKTYKVRLQNQDEVKEFVTVTSKFGFDIDVFYNHYEVDGKSILGIMGLDLKNTLTVRCTEDDPDFGRQIAKYIV